MKNARKLFGVLIVAILICTFAVSLAACNKNIDPETRPLSMSIQVPDGVFNPFFSTSAYDSSIISMTQIGMFNTDQQGQITAGLTEPTVALDYSIKELSLNGEVLPENSSNTAFTEYEILIKNGIKFSDGSPLTIKDVLFNLYVYLDPVFTGSATIYSTDIVGLNAYRTQNPYADESSSGSLDDSFTADAYSALTDLINFSVYFDTGASQKDKANAEKAEWKGKQWNDAAFAYYKTKFNHIAALYMDELKADWNAINMEDYALKSTDPASENTFITEKWQVFMLNDLGYASEILKRENGDGTAFSKTPINGKSILDVEKANKALKALLGEDSDEVLAMPDGDAKEELIKNACIQTAFESVFRGAQAGTDANGNATYTVDISQVSCGGFSSVVTEWASTSSTVFDELVAEAKESYFGTTGLKVANISGITVRKTDSFDGKLSGNKSYTEDHYVLCIRINKVDPKALMNFAFTVAPMKYYSDAEQIEAFDKDFKKWEDNGAHQDTFTKDVTHFGVKFADTNFMNGTVRDKRVQVPIGAGAYQASNRNFDTDVTKITGRDANGFFYQNMIYYTRNEYFWTVGTDSVNGTPETSKLHNANIKHMLYKVVASDQIIASLARGDIDFGDPSATQDNQTELKKSKQLAIVRTRTAGYGYIGINPRYVPDVNIRRAIIKAMNVYGDMIDDYYKGGFADQIFRPMSMESWAYPQNATVYTANDTGYSYEYDSTGKEIAAMLDNLGYTKNSDGIYEDKDGNVCDYKFTIAGGSTDHPAYKCFLGAQEILNKIGFKVQVVTSVTALTDLSAGKLAVWAAAWSSAIDPDMYQVYHIDSQASSVNNWGYKQIKANPGNYEFEYKIIAEEGIDGQSLSTLIDAARETNNQTERTRLYSKCLDLVMELAVEFPTYQRYDIAVYNQNVIDRGSLPKHITGGQPNDKTNSEIGAYYGLLARIWDVNYVH